MTTPGGSTETTYTYEGLTLLSISTSSQAGTTTLTYLHDEAGRPYAALYRSPSTTSTVLVGLITSDRGDIVELVDAESKPFAAYRHDAYGNPTGMPTQGTALIGASPASEIAFAQPLRYAGYCFDAFSGLYYLSARYYDPVTCQFISKDPARADGEESAYQYCGGDPVGKVDASGMLLEEVKRYWYTVWSLEPGWPRISWFWNRWYSGGCYHYWGVNYWRFLRTAGRIWYNAVRDRTRLYGQRELAPYFYEARDYVFGRAGGDYAEGMVLYLKRYRYDQRNRLAPTCYRWFYEKLNHAYKTYASIVTDIIQWADFPTHAPLR